MVNYKFLVLLILLISILPFAQAVQIDDFTFYFADNEVTTVALQKTQFVEGIMTLSVEDNETIESVIIDARELNQKIGFQSTYRALELTCLGEVNNQTNLTTGYTCKTGDFQLNLQTANPQIFLDIQTHNQTLELNHTFSFTVDDTKPNITSIITTYSRDGKYYVKSGGLTTIQFAIQDSVGTFFQRKLFYVLGNLNKKIVSNCSQTSCEGTTLVVCESGQQLKLTITDPSSDDAGNEFIGQTKTVFTCDTQAPGESKEISINVTHNNPIYPKPREGENISIHAYVSEDVSGVTATANITALTGITEIQAGTCTPLPGGEIYDCVWQVRGIFSGDSEVNFLFTDGVSRIKEFKTTISVDKYIRETNTTVPQFFKDITGSAGSEKGFNRIALELAHENGIHFPVFAYFTPQKNSAAGYAEPLNMYIDPTSCELSSPDFATRPSAASYFDDIVITDSLGDFNTKNRLDFYFAPSFDIATLSNVDVVCNVSVVVRANEDTVYQKPSYFTLTTPVIFRNSALSDEYPGEKYANLIREKEDGLDDFWAGVGIANNIMATMSGICSAYGTLSSVSATGRATQLGVALLSKMYPAAGSILDPINQLLGKTSAAANQFGSLDSKREQSYNEAHGIPTQMFNDPMKKFEEEGASFIQKIFDVSCKWTTCSVVDEMRERPDNFYFSGTKLSELADQESAEGGMSGMGQDVKNEVFSQVNVPDPKESILSAIFTKCWSALLYHLNKYRQMKCGVLVCMKEQARYGLDISVCDQIESRYICEAIIGEFFELPYVREIKNIGKNVDKFTQNLIPTTLKIVTSNTFCQKVLNDKTLGADGKTGDAIKLSLCHLPEAIGNRINYELKAKPTKDVFHYPIDEDFCATAKNCQGDDCAPISSSYLGRLLGEQFAKYEDVGHMEDMPQEPQDTSLGLEYNPYLEAEKAANNLNDSDYLIPVFWPEKSAERKYVNYLVHDYKTDLGSFSADSYEVDSLVKAAEDDFNLAFDKHVSKDYAGSTKLVSKFLITKSVGPADPIPLSVYMHNCASLLVFCNDIGLNKTTFLTNFKDIEKFSDLVSIQEDIFNQVKISADINQKELAKLDEDIGEVEEKIRLLTADYSIAKIKFENYGLLENNINYLTLYPFFEGIYNSFSANEYTLVLGEPERIVKNKIFYSKVVVPSDPLKVPETYMGLDFDNFPAQISTQVTDPSERNLFIGHYLMMKGYHAVALEFETVRLKNDPLIAGNKTILGGLKLKKDQLNSQLVAIPSNCVLLRLSPDYLVQNYGADEMVTQSEETVRNELKKNIVDQKNAEKIDAAWTHREEAKEKAREEGNKFLGQMNIKEKNLEDERAGLENKKSECREKDTKCNNMYNEEIALIDNKIERIKALRTDTTKSLPDHMNPDSWTGEGDGNITNYITERNKYDKELLDYDANVEQYETERETNNQELNDINELYKNAGCANPGSQGDTNKVSKETCDGWSTEQNDRLERKAELEKLTKAPLGKPTDDAWKAMSQEERERFMAAESEFETNGETFKEGALQDNLLKQRQEEEAARFQGNLKGYVDMAAAAIVKEGWMNWAVMTNFGRDSSMGQVSQFSENWVSPDGWSEKICSPGFLVDAGGEAMKGSAVSCERDFCEPVLTQAAERMKYNETDFLYTMVYYLKNVPPQSVVIDETIVQYTIHLKTANGHSTKFFASPWENLTEVPHDFAKSFLSKGEYTLMCFEFELNFPPHSATGKKEYCRPITDSTNGESAFDTGDPLAAQLDEEGNVVSATGPGGEGVTTVPFEMAEGFS